MSHQLTNNLPEYRKKHSMTQEELAKKIEVSRQTVIAIEKGNYVPSLMLGLKIARVFSTSVEKIFIID